MKPARDVGGDFYDFFMTDEKHIAFLIADVSDKGVPAALFMMSAKNLINYRAHEGGTPGEILTAVNSQLCRDNVPRMFATVWMGILDLDSGIITCANAGHERPAISSEAGRLELIAKDKHGTPVGMLAGFQYTDYEIVLKEGDSILLYTDGVIEAKNNKGEFYGVQRMVRDASGSETGDGNTSPRCMIENLILKTEEYVNDAEQFDDMTMLCLTYYEKRETTV